MRIVLVELMRTMTRLGWCWGETEFDKRGKTEADRYKYYLNLPQYGRDALRLDF